MHLDKLQRAHAPIAIASYTIEPKHCICCRFYRIPCDSQESCGAIRWNSILYYHAHFDWCEYHYTLMDGLTVTRMYC